MICTNTKSRGGRPDLIPIPLGLGVDNWGREMGGPWTCESGVEHGAERTHHHGRRFTSNIIAIQETLSNYQKPISVDFSDVAHAQGSEAWCISPNVWNSLGFPNNRVGA